MVACCFAAFAALAAVVVPTMVAEVFPAEEDEGGAEEDMDKCCTCTRTVVDNRLQLLTNAATRTRGNRKG